MISPEKIPAFTGDLVELQREIGFMRQAAKAIREHGSAVNARFQHLDASYTAPEAGQLFATTHAVEERAGSFADDLETVAGALTDYVVEVAEIVRQLESLRGQAAVFVESVRGDQGVFRDWTSDQDKVDEHQAIWDGVNAAVAAFQRAEVTCADRITATVGGTRWHIDDGSPKQKNAYGFSADQLGQADELPWGSPAHHTSMPFGMDYHLREFGVSVYDNAAGAVEGLVNLFSPGEEGAATREGLGKVFIGLGGYVLDPLNDRDDLNPGFDRLMDENRPYAKEFAKSFVGWDDWSTNPAKAAGTVVFNGLTLGAGPLGAASRAGGAAGKAGAGARIAGGLAKVGEVLDPIGAATKTVGAAARLLPKVSELTSGIRAATDVAGASDAAHSVIHLSDGSQLRVSDGEFIPGRRGVADPSPAPHEPSAAARVPRVETGHPRDLVGAGARTPQATAHPGDHLPPRGSHDTPLGGGDHRPPAHDAPRSGPGEGRDPGPHRSDAGAQGTSETAQPGGSRSSSGGGDAGPPEGPPHDAAHGSHGGAGADLPGEGQPSPGEHADGPPDIDPASYVGNADDAAHSHTGRMQPEQESAVLAELDRAKMDARDQAAVLRSLRKDPYGAGVAEMLARGHLRGIEGYDHLLDMCKKGPSKGDPKGMVPAAHMAMRLATDLQGRGVGRVGVELDTATFDLDVYTRHPDGSVDYGYQLKDVDNIKGIKSAARKAASQLVHEGIGHRVAILDVHQPRGSLTPAMFNEAEFQARKCGGTFLLRFTDGSVTVPPGGHTFP